jgi:hypothetical protein
MSLIYECTCNMPGVILTVMTTAWSNWFSRAFLMAASKRGA